MTDRLKANMEALSAARVIRGRKFISRLNTAAQCENVALQINTIRSSADYKEILLQASRESTIEGCTMLSVLERYKQLAEEGRPLPFEV